MLRRHHLRSRVVALLGCCLASLAAVVAVAAEPSRRPNIVLILADDLGWSDLGCYGADLVETPQIDRLAAVGVRFTQAYAMSVCSPSRAMLLTGRHAARLRMTIWSEGSRGGPRNRRLLEAVSRHDLPHTEKTLATHLHDTGYLTALVGKWHLGDARHHPETHGFDVNIGGTQWGAPHSFWWPYRGTGRFGPGFRYVPHLEFGTPDEYLTDRLTDEAIRVIDRAGDRPFFLYLSHHAPHTPIEAKADDVAYFAGRIGPGMQHRNATYAAMVRSLDQSVGRVLDHLAARGLEHDTVVVLTSDNGGFIGVDRASGDVTPVTSNAPLRSGKGSLYEGGVRVPLIIRWPGVTPGGAACTEPVTLADLFFTLLPTATASDSTARDGLDIGPLLRNPAAELDRDALFFHYPHYYETTTPVSAVRMRDWKLLESLEDGRLELYNLRDDPSERIDLSAAMPERADAMARRLHDWRTAIDAAMPTPNPDFKEKK